MGFFHQWADPASVLGFLASLVGFAITISVGLRSKKAAEKASEAVAGVREKLALQTAADMDELKALHRASVWEILPARYSSLRRQLATFKGTYPHLTENQKTDIQSIILQFKGIEEKVERSLAAKRVPPDAPSLNRIIVKEGDKLNEIVIAVQQTIGGPKK
jgi:hypothetical protein